MSDLSTFKDWLIEQGGRLLEPENKYQLIRVQMPGHTAPLVMYVTARDKQEWSPALLELHTHFENMKAEGSGFPSSRDRFGGR
ncbi:MAG: hypothetical protein JJ979_26635 [Roseibium sp.]|nr:hypothetical protein [Roseibium sp.]